MHPVTGADDKITVGNHHISLALHRGIKHLGQAVEFARKVLERVAHHHIVLLRAELHHLHPPLGKGFDVACKGKAQQPADFQRGGTLGIDRHVDAHLALQKRQAVVVFRVTDAGDGVLGSQLFGHQAAKHVGFVAGGGGNDDIRLVRPRVHQSGGVGPIATHAQHIQRILAALEDFLAAVHNDHVMPLSCEMFRQRMTYFAVTNHQDSHTSILRIHKAVQIIKGIQSQCTIIAYHGVK